MRTSQFKKGQHVVCRYRLSKGNSNGDLIVGRVESVRSNGDVILHRLPDEKRMTKSIAVLSSRNAVVRKAEALEVVAVFEKSGLHAAREHAVTLARRADERVPGQLALRANGNGAAPPIQLDKVAELRDKYALLSDEEKRAVLRTMLGSALDIFGVE